MSAVVTTGLAFLISCAFFFRTKDRNQQKEETRISVEELNQRIARHDSLIILDLRHPLDVLAAPQLISGAIPVKPDEIDAHVANILAMLRSFCTAHVPTKKRV